MWVYDLRTNKHFTLKTKRMTRTDLDEFVECYRPADRHNPHGDLELLVEVGGEKA